GGVTKTATLTVSPGSSTSGGGIASLTLNPTAVVGGTPSAGTVTVDQVALDGDQTVTLQSSNTGAATVPANVLVPAGATSATFTVTTKSVSSAASVPLSASLGSVTKTASLAVNPASTPPPPPTSGPAVYIAPNGSSSGQGTLASPWDIT